MKPFFITVLFIKKITKNGLFIQIALYSAQSQKNHNLISVFLLHALNIFRRFDIYPEFIANVYKQWHLNNYATFYLGRF